MIIKLPSAKIKRFLTSGLGIGIIIAVVLLVGGGLVYAKLGGAFTSSSSGDINLQKGLVGWWKLDGNAKDSTPYGNNGLAQGTPTTIADRKAGSNQAMAFDGSSDYTISNFNNNVLQTSQFGASWSLSIWAKEDGTDSNQDILLGRQGCNGGIMAFSGHYGFGMYNSGCTSVPIITATPTSMTTWHLLTATYSAGSIKFYLDGQLASSGTVSSIYAYNMTLGIGSGGTASYRFNGSLDDARVYNRALSAAEVTALYNEYGSGVKAASGENGLIGWWKMNGNVKDSTPYSSNGTISGTATYTTDRKGQANDALSFTGSNYDYAKIADGTYFGTSGKPLSVSAWAYVTSSSSGPVFGISSIPGGGTWDMPFLSLNGTTAYGWIYNLAQISKVLTANAWHHLALTYDPTGAGTTTLYVDGASAGTVAGHYSASGARDYFTTYIPGAKPSGVNSYLINTPLQDVRAYSRVLSAGDVSNLYDSYNSQIELGGSGVAGSVSLQKGLVGYWPLNGSAKDATPYSHNGTVSGATLTTDRKGRANSAYSFNGSNTYITLGSITNIPTDISVSAWVYSTNFNQNGFVIGKNPVNAQWEIFFEGSVLAWRGGTTAAVTCADPSNSTWHYLTATQTGTTAKLYIDGTQCGTATVAAIGNGTGAVEIGRFNGGYYFNGSIDDVNVYNRVLNAAEVEALYNEYN